METRFQTTSSAGLDYESTPFKLYTKSKKLGMWDPASIDLEKDREDWLKLNSGEQDLLLRLTALFQAGEESVTQELVPLIWAVSSERRVEEEMFLAAFLFEEAKHVEAFRRFLDEVAHDRSDLTRYHSDQYRTIFYEQLPQAMDSLRTDLSPEVQARAGVTYNMIVEGVLAETGYRAYHTILEERNIMPGMQQMIGLVKQDESRHLAFGLHFLSRLLDSHGQKVWTVIEERMGELLTPALGIIDEIFEAYEEMPFGLTPDLFVDFAVSQFQSRMDYLEARL
jgi:ribonucleoside-diphosphate reductase beta chain